MRISKYLLYFFGGLCLVFLLVWQHVEFVALCYKEAALREEILSLQNRNKYLRIEVARLKAPARIMRIAKQMGLFPAKKVIILEEDFE